MSSPTRVFDDPRASSTIVVGLTFTFLFVAIVVALESYFRKADEREFESKVLERSSTSAASLREQQRARIGEYRWIDEESGVVAVPIERAEELVIEELGKGGS